MHGENKELQLVHTSPWKGSLACGPAGSSHVQTNGQRDIHKQAKQMFIRPGILAWGHHPDHVLLQ